jgi:hypothetical protein
MAQLGPNDLKQFAIPATWDASYLRNVSTADGETYEQLVSDIANGLSVANGALLDDPISGSLVSTTEELTTEYRTGAANEFEPHAEYTPPEGKRSGVTGGMLPLLPWDYKFEWTWDMLRKARRSQIDGDIAAGLEGLRNRYQKSILTRLFKNTYDAVGSGKSVPLADGGTADATYIPIAKPERGGTFLYTHTHYKYLNGITQANLETAVGTIWEHGADAPYELLISYLDLAAWSTVANVTGWVNIVQPGVVLGSASAIANLPDPSYVGAITTKYGPVYVRASGRIPTKYWSVYKSYGNKDARNPLVIRESVQYGTGAVLLAGDHIRQYPLENAILFSEFGVGVQDRVGAVAVYNDSGSSYVVPTIS